MTSCSTSPSAMVAAARDRIDSTFSEPSSTINWKARANRKSADQHGRLVAEHRVGRRHATAQRAFVHHVVVQQGRGVDELDAGRQRDMARATGGARDSRTAAPSRGSAAVVAACRPPRRCVRRAAGSGSPDCPCARRWCGCRRRGRHRQRHQRSQRVSRPPAPAVTPRLIAAEWRRPTSYSGQLSVGLPVTISAPPKQGQAGAAPWH